jgi:multisubunit Na+/H+ antiporter MnhB subunit
VDNRLADIILTQVVLGGFLWLVFALELTPELAFPWDAIEVGLVVAGLVAGWWAWLFARNGRWPEANPRLAAFVTLLVTWTAWLAPAELL